MSYIDTVPQEKASGEVLQMYMNQQDKYEYLPNYARVFCYRPNVMHAWAHLQREVRKFIDTRQYELITLAAAIELKSSYCSLAHSQVLISNHYTPEEIEEMVVTPESSRLTDPDRAMMNLARKVVRDTSAITEEDIEEVRRQGFSDGEIFDIIAAAAARCFFAKIPDALGVKPDPVFKDYPDRLRDVLVVGREIAKPDEH